MSKKLRDMLLGGILDRVLAWEPGDPIPEGAKICLSSGGEMVQEIFDATAEPVVVGVCFIDYQERYVLGRFVNSQFEQAGNWQEFEDRARHLLMYQLMSDEGALGAYVGEQLVYKCPDQLVHRAEFSH